MIKSAFTITGAIIGAGFISGAEIYQFFSRFGIWGALGFIVSASLISLFVYVVINYAINNKAYTLDCIVSPKNSRIIKVLIIAFEFLTYICVYIIMTAGVVAILRDLFQFERIFIPIVFCTVVTIFSLMGIKSVLSFFSVSIPMMLICVVIIAIDSLMDASFNISTQASEPGNWLLSSLLYTSYNFLAGVGVYVSLAQTMKRRRHLSLVVLLSFIFMFFLGISIIIPTLSASLQASDLPMLSCAKDVSQLFYYMYAFLLLLAMFGASLSSLLPMVDWHKISYPEKRTSRAIMASLVSVVCISLSTLGFRELVEHIYTYLGYLGIAFLCMVLYNCLLKQKLNLLFRRKQ